MVEKHEKLAKELYNDLDDDLDPNLDVLEDKFEKFLEMNVNGDVARETILKSMSSEIGRPIPAILDSDDDVVNVSDIDKDDKYVSVVVQLNDVWGTKSDKIAQKGLVEDNSGRIAFLNWKSSNTPLLANNQTYKIEKATVTENNGYPEIHFQDFTEIEMVDSDIDTSSVENSGSVVVEGMIVDVLDSSIGVYRECSKDGCYNKDLDACPDHGDTLGDEIKFRVKVAVDNGENTNLLYLYGSELDKLGFGIDKAKSTVISNDIDKLIERLSKELIFKTVKFEATEVDGNLYVNSVSESGKMGDMNSSSDYNRESFDLFALSDFEDIDHFEKESDDEFAVNYGISSDGQRYNRVLIPSILTRVDYYEEDDYDYIVLNVTDVDGFDKEISVLYNDAVKNHIKNNIDTPSELLILGKVKEFEEDGDIKPTINVEFATNVDSDKINMIREMYDDTNNKDKYQDI